MEQGRKKGGGMKPAAKLWDVIKPPFELDKGKTPYIFDSEWFMCGMVRGRVEFQDYENGEALQDELHQFMVDAMNEKWERMKEAVE
jgi:hypothetical protein